MRSGLFFIEQDLNEEEERSKSKLEYKNTIKKIVKKKVYENLKIIQELHGKVKEIDCNTFRIQEYMTSSSLTNSEASFHVPTKIRNLE